MWVQQLNKLGLISMNKLGTLENVTDMMTKSSGQIGKNDGLLILPMKKLQNFRITRALSRVIGSRNSQ